MGLERSNATVQWTVAGEGWTEPNLNLLPSGADANESLLAYQSYTAILSQPLNRRLQCAANAG